MSDSSTHNIVSRRVPTDAVMVDTISEPSLFLRSFPRWPTQDWGHHLISVVPLGSTRSQALTAASTYEAINTVLPRIVATEAYDAHRRESWKAMELDNALISTAREFVDFYVLEELKKAVPDLTKVPLQAATGPELLRRISATGPATIDGPPGWSVAALYAEDHLEDTETPGEQTFDTDETSTLGHNLRSDWTTFESRIGSGDLVVPDRDLPASQSLE